MDNKNNFIPKQNPLYFLQKKRSISPEHNNINNDDDLIKCYQCKKSTDISKIHQCKKCNKHFCESCFNVHSSQQDCFNQTIDTKNNAAKHVNQLAVSKPRSNNSLNISKCDICKKGEVEVIKFKNHDDAFKYLKREKLFKADYEELENKYSNMKLKKDNSICEPCLNSITSPKNGGVSNLMNILEINTSINKTNTFLKSDFGNINHINMPTNTTNITGAGTMNQKLPQQKIANEQKKNLDNYAETFNYNNNINFSDSLKMSSMAQNVSPYDEKQQQHQYNNTNTQNNCINYYNNQRIIIPPINLTNSTGSVNQSVPYQHNYDMNPNIYNYANQKPNMQIDNSNNNPMNNLLFSSTRQLFYNPQTQPTPHSQLHQVMQPHFQSPLNQQHQSLTHVQMPLQSQPQIYPQQQFQFNQRVFLQGVPESDSYQEPKAQIPPSDDLSQSTISQQVKYQPQIQMPNQSSNSSTISNQSDIENALQMQIQTMQTCSELQKKCLNSFNEFLNYFSKEIQEQKSKNEQLKHCIINSRYEQHAQRNNFYNQLPPTTTTPSSINQYGPNVNNTSINFIPNPGFSNMQNTIIQEGMPLFGRNPYDGASNVGGHINQ